MLQQIQRDSFTSQQHIGKTVGAGDNFSSLDFFAVAGKGFELLLRIERSKHFFSSFKSGNYHFFAGNKTPTSPSISHYDSLRRDIAASQILAQKQTNARVKRAFVQPVQSAASPEA